MANKDVFSQKKKQSLKSTLYNTANIQSVAKAVKNLNSANTDERKKYIIKVAMTVLLEVAVWIAVFLMFLALLIFAASKTPKKTFLGYSVYAIADECLEPDYNRGDCVITGVIDAGEIGVGDFITFTEDGVYAAGIVDSTLSNYKNVNAKFFRVKDAYNNTYVVEPKYITGREVCKISKFGYIVNLLGSKTLYE